MIAEVAVLGGLGFVFAVGLAIASKKLEVKVDEKLEKVKELLPGRNCGACGFASCDEYAEALVNDPSLIKGCRLVADEEREKIAEVVGSESGEAEHHCATHLCRGGSGLKFEYQGIESCAVAAGVGGGFLECKYGCLGFGDCVEACPFGAIELVNGLPQIDDEKCTGCGLCVKECPRHVIALSPRSAKLVVRCHSPEPAKVVAKACKNGCFTCNICERTCPVHAIKMENNLPVIDQATCTACGTCVEKCPRHVLELVKFSEASGAGLSAAPGCHTCH
ncbi:MAG: RnfABCDGE type electron transport complex subunit B [Candidatus Hadarchaeota archaeon]